MRTKAAVLRAIGGPLIIEELEIPPLSEGQLLVKIFSSGLCHSNVNEIIGRKGSRFIPHLTGHEASAEVLEIGKGVTKVHPGDYVVCSWVKGTGLDAPAVTYGSEQGPVNAGACSTFTEYAVISENRVIAIPKDVEARVAAVLGCAVQIGAGIVDSNRLAAGQKLAVFGIGGLGASALIRAVALGVECYAFDVVPWKLAWAHDELGVTALHSDEKETAKYQGTFDCSIECSGNKSAMEMAFEYIKPNGTAIIAGNLEPGTKISIDYWGLLSGKILKGTRGDMCFLDRDVPRYAALYLAGSLPIEKLITKTYAFEDINVGIEDLMAGRLLRGVINLNGRTSEHGR